MCGFMMYNNDKICDDCNLNHLTTASPFDGNGSWKQNILRLITRLRKTIHRNTKFELSQHYCISAVNIWVPPTHTTPFQR